MLTWLPFQRSPTCTLHGSYSTTWTLRDPPLPIAGKSFDLLFVRGERKVGFPFSNFYLPCCATVTVCWPVNLPIIAHSVVGEEECVCVSRTLGSLPLYISCGNTCRELTKELFQLPTKTSPCDCMRTHVIDCVFVCIRRSIRAIILFAVCVFSVCVCMHKWNRGYFGVCDSRWTRVKHFLWAESVFCYPVHFYGSGTASVTLKALM